MTSSEEILRAMLMEGVISVRLSEPRLGSVAGAGCGLSAPWTCAMCHGVSGSVGAALQARTASSGELLLSIALRVAARRERFHTVVETSTCTSCVVRRGTS